MILVLHDVLSCQDVLEAGFRGFPKRPGASPLDTCSLREGSEKKAGRGSGGSASEIQRQVRSELQAGTSAGLGHVHG